MTIVVTRKSLIYLGACQDQVALFTKTFGWRVKVTLEKLIRAAQVGLDIDWWLLQVFPHRRAEYNQGVDALWEKHRQKADALEAKYGQRVDALEDEYGRREDALREEYHQKVGALDDERCWRDVDALWAECDQRRDALDNKRFQKVDALWAECRQRVTSLETKLYQKLAPIIWELIQQEATTSRVPADS